MMPCGKGRKTFVKEKYELLEIEVIEFECEDVITTSTQYPGEDDPLVGNG